MCWNRSDLLLLASTECCEIHSQIWVLFFALPFISMLQRFDLMALSLVGAIFSCFIVYTIALHCDPLAKSVLEGVFGSCNYVLTMYLKTRIHFPWIYQIKC